MCCQVMMLSYMSTKQMLFSVLTRKGRSLGTTFLPPTHQGPGPGWRGRSQLAAPLDHTQLTPLREPDAQDPTGPQTPQANQWQGPGPTDCDQRATAITSQRRGSGRSSLPPQGLSPTSGQSWQGLWSLGTAPRLFLDTPTLPQLTCWPEACWAGGPHGETQDPLLTSLSAWGPRLCQQFAEWSH